MCTEYKGEIVSWEVNFICLNCYYCLNKTKKTTFIHKINKYDHNLHFATLFDPDSDFDHGKHRVDKL